MLDHLHPKLRFFWIFLHVFFSENEAVVSSCNSAAAVPVEVEDQKLCFKFDQKLSIPPNAVISISDANGPPNPQFSLRKPWVLKSVHTRLKENKENCEV